MAMWNPNDTEQLYLLEAAITAVDIDKKCMSQDQFPQMLVRIQFMNVPTLEIAEETLKKRAETPPPPPPPTKAEAATATQSKGANAKKGAGGGKGGKKDSKKGSKKLTLPEAALPPEPPPDSAQVNNEGTQTGERRPSFGMGKSIMFPSLPKEVYFAVKCGFISVYVFGITEGAQCPEFLACTKVKLPETFTEAVTKTSPFRALLCGMPTSATNEGIYDLVGLSGHPIGTITLYIRLSCFGRMIPEPKGL